MHLIIRNTTGTTFINQAGESPASVSMSANHCLYSQTKQFTPETPWADIVAACNAPFFQVVNQVISLGSDVFAINGSGSNLEFKINNQTIDVPKELLVHMADMISQKLELTPVLNFIKRIQQNPNHEIYTELFAWIKNGDLVLTDDGCFLAYKKVREDYMDIYTGSMDNSIGQSPEVPRHKIVRDREQTCAYGLHWCSFQYLDNYGSSSNSRVMIVKVAPEDVDRIPSDYSRQKGVSWKYTVIGEIPYASRHEHLKEQLIYDEATGEYISRS